METYGHNIFSLTNKKNYLNETVLMTGHKMCFYGEMWLIFPKLSLLEHCIFLQEIYTL